jgi:hypothetical protein
MTTARIQKTEPGGELLPSSTYTGTTWRGCRHREILLALRGCANRCEEYVQMSETQAV